MDTWTPPADALRTHAGDLKHICNGDNPAGLPFGKLAPEGTCPRCDERRHGAPPRPRFGGRLTAAQRDAQACADIAAHHASARHRSGGCGLVCTFGDW
jgi:hypothetical protein